MAFITDFQCQECRLLVREVKYNGICAHCRARLSNKAKRVHFAGLKCLSLEERIEKLERAFYDLNVERRLSSLEAKNATY